MKSLLKVLGLFWDDLSLLLSMKLVVMDMVRLRLLLEAQNVLRHRRHAGRRRAHRQPEVILE